MDHKDHGSSEPMKTSGNAFTHWNEMRGTSKGLFVAWSIAWLYQNVCLRPSIRAGVTRAPYTAAVWSVTGSLLYCKHMQVLETSLCDRHAFVDC
jgi:hypothetical protein